jgi:hypothetical protein
MFIQIYNASSFFIPKAASVLSMDISSQDLTVDCNGTVVEIGYLSKLLLSSAFGGLQTLEWLTICEGVLKVLP